MATEIYPSTYEVTRRDIDELTMQAQKVLAFAKSPYEKTEVPVEANLLLRLLGLIPPHKVRQ